MNIIRAVVWPLALAIIFRSAECDTLANGAALRFNGTNQYVSVGSGLFPTVTNSFTMEFWANPTAALVSTAESTLGKPGISDQRYAIFPDHGAFAYGTNDAGVGVSVGTNGIAVFEHSRDYMPSTLCYTGSLSGWTHIAVVYLDSQPTLYLNGNPVRTGLRSARILHPSANLAESGFGYGYYQGSLAEVRLWSVGLDQPTIQSWRNREVDPTHPAAAKLIGNWRLDENGGALAYDTSTFGHDGILVHAPAWVVPGPPIAPSVAVTRPASNVFVLSATLNGWVNPQGHATTVWFEYGQAGYTGLTLPQDIGAAPAFLPVSQNISGLQGESNYHFRCVATNETGLYIGFDRQFRTGGPPSAQTQAGTNTSVNEALLLATVNPNGLATTAWFDWGTNVSLENQTAIQVLSPSFTDVPKTNLLTELSGNTEYFFRVIATNLAGAATGAVHTFTTPCFSNFFSVDGGVVFGSVLWGDFDRDGHLDLVAATANHTNQLAGLFRNDGVSFSCTPAPFGQCPTNYYSYQFLGSAIRGDLNNEGALDVLGIGPTTDYWGSNGIRQLNLFLQDNGTFTYFDIGLPELSCSAAALGDYDNDGYLDFFVTGSTDYVAAQNNLTNLLCRNLGAGRFQVIPTGLPSVYNGAVAWGDYDNDGQLDLLIMGNTGTNLITQIYKNNNGVFTDIGANLPGLCAGAAAWGDYDNDGQIDLLLLGQTNNDPVSATCLLYHNDHGIFTRTSASLPGLAFGSVAWGDLDNDGYLDIAIMGTDVSYPRFWFLAPSITKIFRNRAGAFTEINSGIAPATAGALAWGDFDNDGRLDLAVLNYGFSNQGGSLAFYRNLHTKAVVGPSRPSPPANLASLVLHNGIRLNWESGADAHTPTPGLTYNIRVGTTPGGGQIVPAHSDPASGQRQIPEMGNAQHRLFSVVTNLPLGSHYWSVQTINNSFVGSTWAPEQAFSITSEPPVATTIQASNVLCCSALLKGSVMPGALSTSAGFEWGTTTNLGSSTPLFQVAAGGLITSPVQFLLANLLPLTTYYYRCFATNDAGLSVGTNQVFTTEGPAPIVETVGVTNFGYFNATLLGSSPFFAPPADYFIEWGLTTSYGNLFPVKVLNSALQFDGVDDLLEVGWGKFPQITNNFTLELWAEPTGSRAVTAETLSGTAGFGGQQYAIFPEQGAVAYGTTNHVGAGLSVGTNGVTVSEHTDRLLPTVLVYTSSLSGWTHVAVTYSNHVPQLYLNGAFVRTGLVSSNIVHPSVDLAGTVNTSISLASYGPFRGALQEFRLWDVPLDPPIIQEWMNQPLTPSHPMYSHLKGYWPLNEGRGQLAADASPGVNSGQLLNGPIWVGGRGAANNTFAAAVAGLAPGTTYYFRAVASNSGGIVYGTNQSFTTFPRPQVLSFSSQTDSSYLLRFTGTPSSVFSIEASTNLANWILLSNLPPGTFEFLDSGASNYPTRFYRIRVR